MLRKSFTKRIISLLTIAVIFLSIVTTKALYFEHLEANAYSSIVTVNKKILDGIVDSSVTKLMIVAHPDDEVLWGGGHLMSGDWLVVCLTGGKNKVRSEEFDNVMKASGNKGLMLNYPDKIGKIRNNWAKLKNNIKDDIATVMDYKDWELVTTYDVFGEYGHIQHISTHCYVTDVYDSGDFDFPLYSFGKYYTAARIGSVKDELTPISDEEYQFKEYLSKLYASQSKIIDNLWHMARYEMWTEYEKYTEHPYLNPTIRQKIV